MKLSKSQTILGAIVIIGFIILTIACFVFPEVIPEDVKTAISMAWVLNFGIVIGYVFGSSIGSASKNEIIAAQNKKQP